MGFVIETPDETTALSFKENVPEGISVEVKYPIKEFAEGSIALYTIVVNVGLPIATSLLANWLYDKFKKGKSDNIAIDYQKTVITNTEIENVLLKIARKQAKNPKKR
jgi:hypothetical protein